MRGQWSCLDPAKKLVQLTYILATHTSSNEIQVESEPCFPMSRLPIPATGGKDFADSFGRLTSHERDF
jgi:hypothetical protein